MDEVKLIQAIYCTKKRRGSGKSDESPLRVITEIFDVDGNLLAENDPKGNFTIEDLKSFGLSLVEDLQEGCVERWMKRYGRNF